MRLHELKNVPSDVRSGVGNFKFQDDHIVSDDYLDDLHSIATKYDWKRIGNGAFGVAYEIPGKPYIMKIFPETDRSFAKWMNICMAQKSPHLPKIYGKISKIGRLYGVRMERLTQLKDQSISDMVKAMTTYYPVCVAFEAGDRSLMDQLDVNGRGMVDLGMYNLKRKHDRLNTPEFWDACKTIYDTGLRPDIHIFNIMLRGDVPVFVDPLGASKNIFYP